MTDELQPLGGRRIIQYIGHALIVFGVVGALYQSGAFRFVVPELRVPHISAAILSEKVSLWWAQVKEDIIPAPLGGDLTEAEVRDMQKRLSQDPTIYPEGIVSGVYGDLTTKAVRRFQKKYQLSVTGAADAGTVQKIHDVFALPSASIKTSAAVPAKNTAAAATAVQPKPAPQKPGAITAIVKDQFGSPARVSYWIEGERGVEALRCCSQTNGETGRLETAAFQPGQYVLHIKQEWSYTDFYDSIAQNITVPLGGLWLDTIVVKKWPKVAARLVFPPGTGGNAYLVNAKGERSMEFSSQNAGGRVESNSPVPFGSYIFYVTQYPDIVAERNIQVTETDKEVWLGDIVIVK